MCPAGGARRSTPRQPLRTVGSYDAPAACMCLAFGARRSALRHPAPRQSLPRLSQAPAAPRGGKGGKGGSWGARGPGNFWVGGRFCHTEKEQILARSRRPESFLRKASPQNSDGSPMDQPGIRQSPRVQRRPESGQHPTPHPTPNLPPLSGATGTWDARVRERGRVSAPGRACEVDSL